MARRPFVKLNKNNVGKLLRSNAFANLANDAAQKIADGTDSENVWVRRYRTDRGAASVTLPADEQARDGKLTRGASSKGFVVRGRP